MRPVASAARRPARSRRNGRDEYDDGTMSTGTASLVATADAALKYCYLRPPQSVLEMGRHIEIIRICRRYRIVLATNEISLFFR